MKLRITYFVAVLIGLTSALGLSTAHAQSGAGKSELQWRTSMSAAMKQARAEKKDLLLNFTGSDWCQWCKVLENDVFASEEFRREIPQRFVLVTLDFPADPVKQNPRLAKQNHEWLEKLGVDGFPTVALCDATGRPFTTLGYEEDGVKPFIDALVAGHEIRVARDRAIAAAKKAEGLAKARLIDKALNAIDDALVARHYAAEVGEVLELADRDRDLTSKYRRVQLVGRQQAALREMQTLFMTRDAKDVVLKRLAELEELFETSGQAREQFVQRQIEVLANIGMHREVVDTAKQLLQSKDPDIVIPARMMTLQSLMELGELDAVVDNVASWKSLPDMESEIYVPSHVQALLGLKRVDEAVAVAKSAIDRLPPDDVVGNPLQAWLVSVVEDKADALDFEEFLERQFAPRISEFWIGVYVQPGQGGYAIDEVVPTGPAAKAGLLDGDLLVTVEDAEMTSLDVLLNAIEKAGNTKSITLEVRRDGKASKLDVQPELRPAPMLQIGRAVELAAIPDGWYTDFEDALREAKSNKQESILYFSAKWCAPCQVMLRESFPEPKVAQALSDRFVAYVDLDSADGGAAADRYRVEAVPTMVFLDAGGKELGRVAGFHDADELIQVIRKRGPIAQMGAADANDDGRVQLKEFRDYVTQRVPGGLPIGGIFEELDRDGDGSLNEAEFANRFDAIQRSAGPPVEQIFPDPGSNFVPYAGGSAVVDDSGIFGAVVHRYRALLDAGDWPEVKSDVPAMVSKPDLAGGPCKSADALARATLVLAGGDMANGDFFTAGAVMISSDGLAVTNYHVVENIAETKLAGMDSAGHMHRVIEVLAGNKQRDVALIRLEGEGFNAVTIAESAPSVGSDLEMMHHSEMRFFTYDRGYVMRYARIGGQPWMEISAPYAPGGSGCGIFNAKRELVGLVSTITAGDGPDLAKRGEVPGEQDGWDAGEQMGAGGPESGPGPGFGRLVVKHAVPWSAIQSLWKK